MTETIVKHRREILTCLCLCAAVALITWKTSYEAGWRHGRDYGEAQTLIADTALIGNNAVAAAPGFVRPDFMRRFRDRTIPARGNTTTEIRR